MRHAYDTGPVGQMLACFHSDGILPQLSDFIKIIKTQEDSRSVGQ